MRKKENKTVLVTGFLPFKFDKHLISINPSWEAVRLMKRCGLEKKLNITVIKKSVPVEYEYIDQHVPRMLSQYQPDLVIHVGVSTMVEEFTLEKKAHKCPYNIPDSTGDVPCGDHNPSVGPYRLITDLQVDRICETFNEGLDKRSLKAISSEKAGKYVCEYIYYTSLCKQLSRGKKTLLIHVPMLETKKEFRELAAGLERLVEICVEQI